MNLNPTTIIAVFWGKGVIAVFSRTVIELQRSCRMRF